MAKANIKETMKKSVEGILLLDDEEIMVEVEGFDEPLPFRELYSHFNNRKVKIDINIGTEIKPEE